MLATFSDVESLAKAWLITTPAGALVARAGGGHNVFMAMPTSAPLPAIVLGRIGGAPPSRSDTPIDRARISFDCWATTRAAANAIAYATAAACTNLAEEGGYTAGSARLLTAELLALLWLPDPESDTPRYVVDALFTVLTAAA